MLPLFYYERFAEYFLAAAAAACLNRFEAKMSRNGIATKVFYLLLSIGAAQVIRLLSNLVLTRLLAPEMFALMLMVTVVMSALAMFSDVGIRPAVITSNRSYDRTFCDTAWTMQVLRGLLIYCVILAICVPVSNFYETDILVPMLAAVGLMAILDGFTPIRVCHEHKELRVKNLALIDTGTQLVGSLLMIAAAYYMRSVWSLVLGAMVSGGLRIACYYVFINGHGHRFRFDLSSFKEIFGFSRWLFISSMCLFVSREIDKVIVGKVMPLEMVGQYSVAVALAMVVREAGQKIANRILLPLYNKLVKSADGLRKIRLYRNAGILASVVASIPFIIGGQSIINVLYDERYMAAGGMLQVLCLGGVFTLMDSTLRPIFEANRRPKDMMLYQIMKGVLALVLALVLVKFFGLLGVFVAVVSIPLLSLIILHGIARKHGYIWFFDDIAAVVVVAIIVFLCWNYMGIPSIFDEAF